MIYSLIRKREKKLIYGPFIHQTVELPCTKERNYSHIFLFDPASIEQQLFSPPGFPLQACNFFWSEYFFCSNLCRETLLYLPCKGSVNGNLPAPGEHSNPIHVLGMGTPHSKQKERTSPWLCFPNFHFIVSGKGKEKGKRSRQLGLLLIFLDICYSFPCSKI